MQKSTKDKKKSKVLKYKILRLIKADICLVRLIEADLG